MYENGLNIVIRNDMTMSHVAWNCSTTSDNCFSQWCVWYWPDHTEHQIMWLHHIPGLWCHTRRHDYARIIQSFCETVCVSSSDWIHPQQTEIRIRETHLFFLDWMIKRKHLQSLWRQCSFFVCFEYFVLWICF